MPQPSSTQQKVLAAQFISHTGASERQAIKSAQNIKPSGRLLEELELTVRECQYLKSSDFRLNDAVNTFYDLEPSNRPALGYQLDKLFDTLRDDEKDDKNKLELDSTMAYLAKTLKVNLENVELFIPLAIVKAPSLGEITRRGFIEGWLEEDAGSSSQVHAAHIRKLASKLSRDAELFKRVYRHAFEVGRENDQKALGLENALVFWNMLFSSPGMVWKSENHDWLALWKSFLDEKWTRSVNRDMWNMTLEFALKSMMDDSLSFWSEDGAWPSVIDEFVGWCRARGIGKPETMEVDQD